MRASGWWQQEASLVQTIYFVQINLRRNATIYIFDVMCCPVELLLARSLLLLSIVPAFLRRRRAIDGSDGTAAEAEAAEAEATVEAPPPAANAAAKTATAAEVAAAIDRFRCRPPRPSPFRAYSMRLINVWLSSAYVGCLSMPPRRCRRCLSFGVIQYLCRAAIIHQARLPLRCFASDRGGVTPT